MSFLGNLLVGALTFLHVGIVVVILTGWLFPKITYLYGLCLIATALSWLLFKRCLLVDIEFMLRRFFNMSQPQHDKSFTATFVNKLFGNNILSDRLVIIIGVIVLSASIPYWIYSTFI